MEAVLGGRRRRARVEAHVFVAAVVLIGASVGGTRLRWGGACTGEESAEVDVVIDGEGQVFSANRVDGVIGRSYKVNCYSPPMIYTGDFNPFPCGAEWIGESGGEVFLSAVPAEGWSFDHWETDLGRQCWDPGQDPSKPRIMMTLPLGEKRACKAVFTPSLLTLHTQITSMVPDRGPVYSTVEINGEEFDVESSFVSFNGVDATISNATKTKLTTSVPPGATSGPVTVLGRFGQVTYANFTVDNPAVIPDDMGGIEVLDLPPPPPDLMAPANDMVPAVTIDSLTLVSSTAHAAGVEQQSRNITVDWTTTNATYCQMDTGGAGTSVALSGTRTFGLVSEQNLRLLCTGPGGPVQRILRIPNFSTFKIGWTRVEPAIPSTNQSYRVVFAAPPEGVCTFDGVAQSQTTPGMWSVYQTAPSTAQTVTHTIACSATAGNETMMVTVPVVSDSRPEVMRWGQRTRLVSGEPIALNFLASYATDCTLDGVSVGNGSSLTTRTFNPPIGTTTYTLTCTTTITGTQYSYPWVVEKE